MDVHVSASLRKGQRTGTSTVAARSVCSRSVGSHRLASLPKLFASHVCLASALAVFRRPLLWARWHQSSQDFATCALDCECDAPTEPVQRHWPRAYDPVGLRNLQDGKYTILREAGQGRTDGTPLEPGIPGYLINSTNCPLHLSSPSPLVRTVGFGESLSWTNLPTNSALVVSVLI